MLLTNHNTGSRIAQSVMQELGIYWNKYFMCYKLWEESRDSRIDGPNESVSYQQRQSEELLNRSYKPSVTQHHICNTPPPSYIMPPSSFWSGKAVVCKPSLNRCQNCTCRSSSLQSSLIHLAHKGKISGLWCGDYLDLTVRRISDQHPDTRNICNLAINTILSLGNWEYFTVSHWDCFQKCSNVLTSTRKSIMFSLPDFLPGYQS